LAQQLTVEQVPKPISKPDVEMADCDDLFVKIDGILIKQDFDQLIMSPADVAVYTPLQSATMH